MEDEVQRAALAMVLPTTDPDTRRYASQFLERWTRTVESCDVYVKWLTSFRQQEKSVENGNTVNVHEYQISMQLLCLTMLQSKLRHELMSQRNDGQTINTISRGIVALRTELWEYLRQQPTLDQVLLGPCCICTAIITVRTEGALAEFIANACNNNLGLPQETVLRLMTCLPAEMEARRDLTTSQVTEGLQFQIEGALDVIRRGLISNENPPSVVLTAYQALQAWTEISQASLTQINTPTCGGPHAILPAVINFLSSCNGNDMYDELTLQSAARALMATIMVVSDLGTSTRKSSAAVFRMAIPQQGFIVHPLQIATDNKWHNASHALASLLTTFMVEYIDEIVGQPADMGLQVLLEIQSHPSTSVALIPLECWLTIQEIPTGERHEHWKRPLYKNLVDILLRRVAYPPQFTGWENELVDSSDFYEFRRMATDVLVSCYFLLRYEMIQMLTQQVQAATDWRTSEAALFVLAQISKDSCARCRSHAADGTLIARDRQATQQELLQLLEQLVSVHSCVTNAQHKYLLSSVLCFCGNYSPAWNSMKCPPQAILQLLVYLQSAFSVMPLESSKATRAIYVSCLAKNMPNLEDLYSNRRVNENSILPMILKSVRTSMEYILLTSEEEAMTTVAEGATRVVTKLVNPTVAREAITTDLVQPVINHIFTVLKALPESDNTREWMSPIVQSAIESLSRLLSVVRIISRFCDAPRIPAMGEWLLHQIDPCLQLVQQRTARTPAQPFILPKWISIHQQILRSTLPQQGTIVKIFTNTIPLIVQALEQTKNPGALKYISTAVEMFGGQTLEMDKSFTDLLAHVTTEVITNKGNTSDAMEFLQAYFECLQRYTLYCPRALCYDPQLLSNIVEVAVESVSVVEAKESTRAALIFLSQLLGWNSLRLSHQSSQILTEAWNSSILKELILRHGQTITQSCVSGLIGGPQILMAAYSDTLFAVVQAIVMNQKGELGTPPTPADNISSQLNENLIQNWLLSSMANIMVTNNIDTVMNNQIIAILLSLARNNSNSRLKAKAKAKLLLTDFTKIRKGEMTSESLMSYQLP